MSASALPCHCHFHCMQELAGHQPHLNIALPSESQVSLHWWSWTLQCKICTVNQMFTYLNRTSTLHCLLQSSSVNVVFLLSICSIFASMIYSLLYNRFLFLYSAARKGYNIIKTVILHFDFQNARTDTTCPVWSLSGSEAGQDRTWWKAPSQQTWSRRVYEE